MSGFSYGTFGFWSAFLKGHGDVILATGTSQVSTFIEEDVSKVLHRWIFLKDPCYGKDEDGNIRILSACKDRI
jgi:hypothetical protein